MMISTIHSKDQYMKSTRIFLSLMMLISGLYLSSCTKTSTTEPAADIEVVRCSTTIAGSPTIDGSKIIMAAVQKSTSPPIQDGFIVMGYATTDISPKTRLDDAITVVFRPTSVGTYPVSYPFGSVFSIARNGVSYISIQGTITVTRYDAVGGWVEGTFEGTANSSDGRTSITVTNGVFKVKRDPDGTLG